MSNPVQPSTPDVADTAKNKVVIVSSQQDLSQTSSVDLASPSDAQIIVPDSQPTLDRLDVKVVMFL